jgi:multidrug efflux pump subunit AcrA (membrane-fusion protein)
MSTSANPSAAPLETPAPVGPRPLEPPPERFRNRKRGLIATAVVAVLGFGLWLYLKPQPQQKQAAAPVVIRTAVVRAGSLEQTLRLSGNTVAGNYANIAAPLLRGPEYRNLVLIALVKGGTMAKKGEILAELDPTQARDHMDDVQADITQAEANIRKRIAEQAISDENQRQSIRVAKAALEKAKLDLKAAEVRTPIDQQLLQLIVEENEAAYQDAVRNFEIDRVSNRADLRILEITKERQIRHYQRHETDLVRFKIISPMEGLVVMQSIWRGGDMAQIQLGDQLAPNQPFMKIVDPKSMQLDAWVNQVESESIRVGQPAVVRFDAFPGIQLKGKVHSIGAIAVGSWRASNYIRNVPVKIKMLEQHPQVIPDLTASADVVIGTVEGKVLVPLDAVFSENGKRVVYVARGQGFQAREVQLAGMNNTTAAVTSGVNAGDAVALQHPTRPAK